MFNMLVFSDIVMSSEGIFSQSKVFSCVCMHAHLFGLVWLFVTSQTVAHQAPLSMRFPKREYWSGLSFPSPGDLPGSEIEPTSPALEGEFFTTESPRKPSSLTWVF